MNSDISAYCEAIMDFRGRNVVRSSKTVKHNIKLQLQHLSYYLDALVESSRMGNAY